MQCEHNAEPSNKPRTRIRLEKGMVRLIRREFSLISFWNNFIWHTDLKMKGFGLQV